MNRTICLFALVSVAFIGCGENKMAGGSLTKRDSNAQAAVAGKSIVGFELCVKAGDKEACKSSDDADGKPEFVKISKSSGKVSLKIRARVGSGDAVRGLGMILSVGTGAASGTNGSSSENQSSSSETTTTTTTTAGVPGVVVGPAGCFWDPYGAWRCDGISWWQKYCVAGYYHPYWSPYYCQGGVIPGQTSTTTQTTNNSSGSSSTDNEEMGKLFGKGEELEVNPVLADGKRSESKKFSLPSGQSDLALMPALIALDSFSKSAPIGKLTVCLGSSKASLKCSEAANADEEWVETDAVDLFAGSGFLFSVQGE